MDKLPVLTAYNLLVGAKESKQKELNQLKEMWGENPTHRQEKKLAKLEAKIAELDSIIPQIEAFMSTHHATQPEKEQSNG